MKKLSTITLLILFSSVSLSRSARSGSPTAIMNCRSAPPDRGTVRLALAPLDPQGNPRPPTPSSALEPVQILQPRDHARCAGRNDDRSWRIARECQTFAAYDHRPPTFCVLVQELVVDPTDGSITFHTDAPVFGLGEGQQQFDRRGTRYTMINGQTAPFLATHGATIPVPFLIGADGWAMFLHCPVGPIRSARWARQIHAACAKSGRRSRFRFL